MQRFKEGDRNMKFFISIWKVWGNQWLTKFTQSGDTICITQNIGEEVVNVREQFKEGQWYKDQAMLESGITTK